jgi:hypothetical protein
VKRKTFQFSVRYFKKDTGKFYVSDRFEIECQVIEASGGPYMYDVKDHIDKLRYEGVPLPGLSGSWDGFILVDHP